jgi:hypothetical protein
MMRDHGSSMKRACSGTSNLPDAKCIHNGEEEVPVPLSVDDEKAAAEKEVAEKEVEIELVPPEAARGSSDNDDSKEDR